MFVGKPSRWANPFEGVFAQPAAALELSLFRDAVQGIWTSLPLRGFSDAEFNKVVETHRRWRGQFSGHPLDAAHAELSGRTLACWCAVDDRFCHAAILVRMLDR